MNLYTDIEKLGFQKPCILTIGSFDGVHLGHQQILKKLDELSKKNNLPAVVLTFINHPRFILDNQQQSILLNTLQEKCNLLEKFSIKHCVGLSFTKEFSKMNAHDFIKNFLIKYFSPSIILVGYDHQFGNNREGNIHLLRQYEKMYNFRVIEIPELIIKASKLSSSSIRTFLLKGDVLKANELLGYAYFFTAKVIRGKQLGRTINFPTANLSVHSPHKLLPINGVYAVKLKIENDSLTYKGMMNIGTNPTVNSTLERKIEVHIFDFNKNIYDLNIQVLFEQKIRDEIKFNSLIELQKQLEEDKKIALAI